MDVARSLPGRMAAWAAAEPRLTAIVVGDERIDYGQLADAVAARTADLKAGSGSVRVDVSRRGASVAVAALAAMSVGRCYAPGTGQSDAPELDCQSDDPPAYLLTTSGSTGRPKLVAGYRSGVANYLVGLGHAYDLGRDDRVLQMAPLTYDASVRDLLCPLGLGATVIIAPDPLDFHAVADLAANEGVTHVLSATPGWLAGLLETGRAGRARDTLRLVACGGEAVPESLAGRLWDDLPDTDLLVHYGASECTMSTTYSRRRPRSEPAGVGHALPGTRYLVVDEIRRPAPDGRAGEVALLGLGVPRQLPDGSPPSLVDGEPAHLTGDLGRIRSDGALEILGRLDRVRKVAGRRVSLDDVERLFSATPGVTACHAETFPSAAGNVLCVAYTSKDDAAPTSWPAATDADPPPRPQVIVRLARMPRGRTGKIDRRSADRQIEAALAARTTVERRDDAPLLRRVAKAWAEVLPLHAFRADTDIFQAGGDSLTAARLATALRREFPDHGHVDARFVYAHPTATGQAVELSAPPKTRHDVDRSAHGRETLYMAHRSRTLNLTTARVFHLTPAPDNGLLDAALRRTALGHPDLTRPLQVRRGRVTVSDVECPIVADHRPGARADVGPWVRALLEDNMDVERDAPLRVDVLDLPNGDAALLIRIHHAAADARSWEILLSDLSREWALAGGTASAGATVPGATPPDAEGLDAEEGHVHAVDAVGGHAVAVTLGPSSRRDATEAEVAVAAVAAALADHAAGTPVLGVVLGTRGPLDERGIGPFLLTVPFRYPDDRSLECLLRAARDQLRAWLSTPHDDLVTFAESRMPGPYDAVVSVSRTAEPLTLAGVDVRPLPAPRMVGAVEGVSVDVEVGARTVVVVVGGRSTPTRILAAVADRVTDAARRLAAPRTEKVEAR